MIRGAAAVQHVRQRPLRREEELHRQIDEARRAVRKRQELHANEVVDQKESASGCIERSLSDVGLERDLVKLREMEAARQRLDKGSSGRCTDCGEAIEIMAMQCKQAQTLTQLLEQQARSLGVASVEGRVDASEPRAAMALHARSCDLGVVTQIEPGRWTTNDLLRFP